MYFSMAGFSLVVILLLSSAASAQDVNLAEAQDLYLQHCGACHGQMPSEARLPVNIPLAPALVRVAMAQPDVTPQTLRDVPVANPLLHVSMPLPAASMRVAVALPYGPSLRGVYGRPAGSMTGFAYSRAFKTVLTGTVWNGETLDVWITNSQKRAPGVRMFYKQPDAEIRRKIIAYLKANS